MSKRQTPDIPQPGAPDVIGLATPAARPDDALSRDWLAGMALAGLCAVPRYDRDDEAGTSHRQLARQAYKYADAMLVVRLERSEAAERRQRRQTIAIEELQAALTMLWPGQDQLSKQLKQVAIYTLFETRSWTALESFDPDLLEAGFRKLAALERAGPAAVPVTAAAVAKALAADDEHGAGDPRATGLLP